MTLVQSLKKFLMNFEKRKKSLFTYAADRQKAYLESIGDANSDLERSFNQYKCKMKMYGFPTKILFSLGSLALIPFFFLRKKNATQEKVDEIDAVFIADGKPENILPDDVRKEYPNLIIYERSSRRYGLCSADRSFIKEIWSSNPFSWHFILKSMLKIAMYSYIIDKYKPKAIIVCAEYSFTSSLLTSYCERCGVKHINVMHGEKLYYMRDSYFRFHRCYIWDDFYKKLFIQLKADPNQFIVSMPKSLVFADDNSLIKTYDFTYYLANEDLDSLKRISLFLDKLSDRGMKIAVRSHPRYSDESEIKRIFKRFEIEDPGTLTIEDSLLRTKKAISLFSTVLNQAFHNGVGVVIDDLSNPEFYEKLFQLKYINLSRTHELLSEILKK